MCGVFHPYPHSCLCFEFLVLVVKWRPDMSLRWEFSVGGEGGTVTLL